MGLAERLLKTLRDIASNPDQSKLDLKAAEQLCNMRLVEAGDDTDYPITARGEEFLTMIIDRDQVANR